MKVIITIALIYAVYLASAFKTNLLIIENCHMAMGDAAIRISKSSGRYGDKKAYDQAIKDLEKSGKFCGAVSKVLKS